MNALGNTEKNTLWIEQLLKRYTHVVITDRSPEPELLLALNTLQLADAVLSKLQLVLSNPEHCLQVAIIGPTQSGKSTLVNVLLDGNPAGISALAGFTVHAQGFAASVNDTDLLAIETLMAPMLRTPAAQLDANDLNTYALESVSAGDQALIDKCVVWDTPDFDSIESVTYKRAVLRTMGFADILVLAISKDKYGDKSVWDMLALLHTLRQPLLVCLNKLDKSDEQTVLNAFSQRFVEQFESPAPPIVMLPFVRRSKSDNRVNLPQSQQAQLTAALDKAKQQLDRAELNKTIDSFINQHRRQWLAPLSAEKQAQSKWSSLVDSTLKDAEQRYLDGYLNNPDKYDTFNRALAELLALLEIPGLAPVLARTRQLVTWPARKLLGMGRTVIGNQFNPSGNSVLTQTPPDQEADILQNILDAALIGIQRELLSQPQDTYWRAMNLAFRQQEAGIREKYTAQSAQARKNFEPLIDAAAQRLYEQLQSQPALLNTLRATRVTADAAGVALAIKSGGLAPADLILAPAMFSVTTLLTESALGKYLDSVKRELKEQQGKHINERVLHGVIGEALHSLSKTLDDKGLFTQQIEPELEQILTEKANYSA